MKRRRMDRPGVRRVRCWACPSPAPRSRGAGRIALRCRWCACCAVWAASLSFSLLEYGLLSLRLCSGLDGDLGILIASAAVPLVRLLRRLTALLTAAAIAFGALWLPLYARDARRVQLLPPDR